MLRTANHTGSWDALCEMDVISVHLAEALFPCKQSRVSEGEGESSSLTDELPGSPVGAVHCDTGGYVCDCIDGLQL